ncbi:hypothetical protein GCM10010185_28920 [Saccharothrix coeruleofusca]|uniref:Uncharacterized protein n=1 Tax=Saccharothrix coeruleofusca TaxID=33919 RepID=A0A918APK6_9PSEU|nr:hypothetical protein GCM10010185_28920 [Saccharothrix coeruleofusca]
MVAALRVAVTHSVRPPPANHTAAARRAVLVRPSPARRAERTTPGRDAATATRTSSSRPRNGQWGAAPAPVFASLIAPSWEAPLSAR